MKFPMELKTTDGRDAVILGMNEHNNFIGYIKGSPKSCRWYSDTYEAAMHSGNVDLIKPIQIKEGGLYRMQNGNKIRITWKNNNCDEFYGYAKPNMYPYFGIWKINGEYVRNFETKNYDIVEEIEE